LSADSLRLVVHRVVGRLLKLGLVAEYSTDGQKGAHSLRSVAHMCKASRGLSA
jgi:hypothetical protein